LLPISLANDRWSETGERTCWLSPFPILLDINQNYGKSVKKVLYVILDDLSVYFVDIYVYNLED
jgi:hypothetical protein